MNCVGTSVAELPQDVRRWLDIGDNRCGQDDVKTGRAQRLRRGCSRRRRPHSGVSVVIVTCLGSKTLFSIHGGAEIAEKEDR